MSIDVEGFIWLVDPYSDRAYEVDPAMRTSVAAVLGLAIPHTYSDMTGAGQSLVTNSTAFVTGPSRH